MSWYYFFSTLFYYTQYVYHKVAKKNTTMAGGGTTLGGNPLTSLSTYHINKQVPLSVCVCVKITHSPDPLLRVDQSGIHKMGPMFKMAAACLTPHHTRWCSHACAHTHTISHLWTDGTSSGGHEYCSRNLSHIWSTFTLTSHPSQAVCTHVYEKRNTRTHFCASFTLTILLV